MGKHNEPESVRVAPIMRRRKPYRLAQGGKVVCRRRVNDVGAYVFTMGRVVFIHPGQRFVVVEFEGKPSAWGRTKGKWRETIWPENCAPATVKGLAALKGECV